MQPSAKASGGKQIVLVAASVARIRGDIVFFSVANEHDGSSQKVPAGEPLAHRHVMPV